MGVAVTFEGICLIKHFGCIIDKAENRPYWCSVIFVCVIVKVLDILAKKTARHVSCFKTPEVYTEEIWSSMNYLSSTWNLLLMM